MAELHYWKILHTLCSRAAPSPFSHCLVVCSCELFFVAWLSANEPFFHFVVDYNLLKHANEFKG